MPAGQPSTLDAALARAVVYRMLSIGFQPPTKQRLDAIGARDGFRVLVAALQYLDPRADGFASAAAPLSTVTIPDAEAVSAGLWPIFGLTTCGPLCAGATEFPPD